MLFNSFDFLLFFPIVTLIYFVVPRKIRYLWLLVSSYYFYMSWKPEYAILLAGSTVITWGSGILIHKCKDKAGKKLCVAISVALNLICLFYFKYSDFFKDTLNDILRAVNIETTKREFDMIVPVGISFYVFQALGYTIDVYREKIKPERNPFRYALFVSFFPQLVAGPIERSDRLLKQMKEIDKKKVWNFNNVTHGLTLMVWGLFVKMVIADRVAILVKTVFDEFYFYGSMALLVGAIGFALQIYCDFMGYSTIAIGAARVMGFSLMENFETPYLSCSVSEFWRRWHISLSTWFRDYVYIPLGGSRVSKTRKYVNVMITMAVSGLWHGANWTFLIWGLLHGIYQVVGDATKTARNKLYQYMNAKTQSVSFKLAQGLCTFALVDFAWIFFRAESISDALLYIKRIVTKWDPWSFFDGELYRLGLDRFEFRVLTVAIIVLIIVDCIRYFKKQDIYVFLKEQCIWFRWMVLIGLICAILVYGIYGIQFESSQFIYFQF